MSTPYTYRIKCIPTGQSYYGVRYAKECCPSDLWESYFTSSSLIHKLIEYHGPDQFEFEIRKTFDNKDEACQWEHKVLQRLRILSNSMWLNMHTGKNKASDSQISSKNGKANKGRKHINTNHKQRGIYQSTIKWMHHPKTNREVQAAPAWIKYYQSQGFILGRREDLYSDKWRNDRSKQYSGENNPSYGLKRNDLIERNKQKRRWLTNGEVVTKVTEDKIPELIAQGYWIGRQ